MGDIHTPFPYSEKYKTNCILALLSLSKESNVIIPTEHAIQMRDVTIKLPTLVVF